MKKIRWSDFSLVSKIMIEVGVLAVLLFSINMLFYARINNSMQEMDDVYASNAQITRSDDTACHYSLIDIAIQLNFA